MLKNKKMFLPALLAVVVLGMASCVNLPDNLDGTWKAEDSSGATQTITISGTNFVFKQNTPKVEFTGTLVDTRGDKVDGTQKGKLKITIETPVTAKGFAWETDYALNQTTEDKYLLKMKVPTSFSASAKFSENTYTRQ